MTYSLYITGCTNEYVKVIYDSTTSTIFCTFLNELDTTEKSCSIKYGLCNQELVNSTQGFSTTKTPNSVSLKLTDLSDGVYCYVVSASSDNIAINVKGSVLSLSKGRF